MGDFVKPIVEIIKQTKARQINLFERKKSKQISYLSCES